MSTRAVLSKRAMDKDTGKSMSPANLYAVVNIMAAAMFLSISAILEDEYKVDHVWEAAGYSDDEEYVPMHLSPKLGLLRDGKGS